MSRQIAKIAQNFLSEVSKVDISEGIQMLITELEEKVDPDPIEVRLIAQLYHFTENIELVKNNLRRYVEDFSEKTPGTKLSSLWENQSNDGNAKQFKL